MQARTLGQRNLDVAAIGLGCMGMNFSYPPFPDRQELTPENLQAIENATAQITVEGARYPKAYERRANLYSVRWINEEPRV